MRLIFISPHSDPKAQLGEPDAGGQCEYEDELALALARTGDQILTFCRQRDSRPVTEKVSRGYTIYRIPCGPAGFIPKEEIGQVLPEFTIKMATILSGLPLSTPTVINNHYWDGVKSALLLKANYRDYPLVWTPHSLGFSKRNKFRGLSQEMRYRFVNRLTWENYGSAAADHMIVLSRSDKMKLIRNYAVLANRITIIPPGVSIHAETTQIDYRKAWHIEPDTIVLVSIGRIVRSKGFHHLVKILHILHAKKAAKFVLVIVGGQTQIVSDEEKRYRYELRKLVENLGLQEFVIFQPSVPHTQIQAIYQATDIYLMASEDEPFGLTLVEAMYSGKAVIAHGQGGAKDIVQNGINGITTDMHKYQQVADIITKLISHKSRLQNLGQRAQTEVAAKYSWETRIPNYKKVFQQAITDSSHRLPKLISYDYALREGLKL